MNAVNERWRRRVGGQRGTTLLELMIGLIVLTILTGIATPGISALVRRQNLRNAAEDVIYAANTARSRARTNRRAYGVSIGKTGMGGEPLTITVRRGSGTDCGSLTDGTVEYLKEYTPSNNDGLAPVVVTARAPSELRSGKMFLCFKPDGRVVRGDTEQPFRPAVAGWFAGDVYFELQRVDGSTRIGPKLQVKVGYNGSTRITYGLNLGALQG